MRIMHYGALAFAVVALTACSGTSAPAAPETFGKLQTALAAHPPSEMAVDLMVADPSEGAA